MEITHRGAVAELSLQVFLDPAVELHRCPVCLPGQGGIFNERHDLLGHLRLGQDAPPPAAAAGNESVKTGEIEGLDQTQHMTQAEA